LIYTEREGEHERKRKRDRERQLLFVVFFCSRGRGATMPSTSCLRYAWHRRLARATCIHNILNLKICHPRWNGPNVTSVASPTLSNSSCRAMRILEPMAPSLLNISSWRAMRIPFMTFIVLLEPLKYCDIYCIPQEVHCKGELWPQSWIWGGFLGMHYSTLTPLFLSLLWGS
jgi:hypothetical protein